MASTTRTFARSGGHPERLTTLDLDTLRHAEPADLVETDVARSADLAAEAEPGSGHASTRPDAHPLGSGTASPGTASPGTASPRAASPRAWSRRPPHVVHVSQPVEAGVAMCVRQYVVDQLARGWPVTVVCPPGSWLADEVDRAGAAVLSWPAERGIGPNVVGETLRLRHLLAGLGPQLVHLHSSKSGLAGRLATRDRVPTLFQPHAWSFETLEGPTRRAALTWERRAARWARRIVCVSDAERRTGLTAGIHAAYAVVPNGVDTARFSAATDAARRAARARLGLPEAPLAVCLGRLSEQKGQDLLLAAWPAVRTRVPLARLALVGDGPLRDRLETAAAGLDGVDLVGSTDAVKDWLAAADVVVVPSRYEGMALVPLEAMARARSVVVSDIAPNRESVPSGAGASVDARDPAALAAAVAERLSDASLAAREGRAGRSHVQARHDARVASERLVGLYADVLLPEVDRVS